MIFNIPEPKLTFGYNQKVADPRDGLTMFGPFAHKNILPEYVNVGIIGANTQRQYLKEYIKKIHFPINSDKDIARPFFPGLSATFGIKINEKAIKEILIPDNLISEYLKYSDGYQRVHHLSNLFADKLIKYSLEEEHPVTVWFVAIPQEVYKACRPKSYIKSSIDNNKIGLKKQDRNALLLFDDMNQLREAYDFEINFHNQLKAKLLRHKIITQIVRDETIAYEQIWSANPNGLTEAKITREKIMDADKAWSISNALYYKSGRLPWKLGEVREKVCYIGLVYKKIEYTNDNRTACCAAQMFLDSGDGMVFRGVTGKLYDPKTREFHLSYNDANALLSQSIQTFEEIHGRCPEEIFIHSKTYFNDDEWNGFSHAVKNKSKIVGIRIREDSSFKLFRGHSYCVPRGTVFQNGTNKDKAYLWTKGFVPRLQTQMGLETPNPLSIEITRGDSDMEIVCKDVLALTKLNYNSCKFADGLPVTLRFADSIGEILTSGKDVKTDVLPFKHYI